MLKEERFKKIMKQINLHNKVLSIDLSSLLKVSEDTVRRDLKELADADQLVRVHGGAVSKTMVKPFISGQSVYAQEEKQTIAKKAIALIKDDMTILMEGGTTMFEIANIIPDSYNLTIFTVSPQIAIALSDHENVNVYTIGGRLHKNSNIHVGTRTINELYRLRCDLCFMGVNALSVERGLTDIDLDLVEVNKAMFEVSNKKVLITISEKMNVQKRYQIADLSRIDYLITELPPHDELLKPVSRSFPNLCIL